MGMPKHIERLLKYRPKIKAQREEFSNYSKRIDGLRKYLKKQHEMDKRAIIQKHISTLIQKRKRAAPIPHKIVHTHEKMRDRVVRLLKLKASSDLFYPSVHEYALKKMTEAIALHGAPWYVLSIYQKHNSMNMGKQHQAEIEFFKEYNRRRCLDAFIFDVVPDLLGMGAYKLTLKVRGQPMSRTEIMESWEDEVKYRKGAKLPFSLFRLSRNVSELFANDYKQKLIKDENKKLSQLKQIAKWEGIFSPLSSLAYMSKNTSLRTLGGISLCCKLFLKGWLGIEMFKTLLKDRRI